MELTSAPTPEILVPPSSSEPQLSRIIFGTFFLGESEFAIEMTEIQEITNIPGKLQKMPLAPAYLRGLFNLRGRILPVIDLALLLQLQPTPPREEDIPCMVILRQGPACVGILFDDVGEILRLRPDDVIPVQHQNSTDAAPCAVKSILTQNNGARVIQILNLGALLAIRNLPSLERRSPSRMADKNFVTQRMQDLRREKLIGFTVAGCNLAFEMKCVLALLDNKETRPSPRKSPLCNSVIMFAKHMVPVVPLAQLLNLESAEAPERILVCKVGNDCVGFLVHHVTSIIPYATNKVLPIPVLDEHRASVLRGCFADVDGTEFLVLNEQGILSNPEIVEISVGHRQLSDEQEERETRNVSEHVSLLTFRMGKLYGIKILDVVEVLVAPKELVRTPAMPSAVLGVLNLRGTPISVLDPRQLLHLEPAPRDEPASILVFLHKGRKIGMRVDSVESILSVPAGGEMELPEIFFREEQPKLMDTFERGLHLESDGVKNVVLVLSADQIVKLLVSALNSC